MDSLIYTCRACSRKNRIVGPIRRKGFYKCGGCGAELVRREVAHHERLVMDVRRELDEVEKHLQNIKSSLLGRKRIAELRNRFRHSTSRLQNWHDSVEFIRDAGERDLIFNSYSPDLMAISESAGRIIIALDEKDWLKKTMAGNPELRHLVSVIGEVLGIVANVLSLFGIGGPLAHMLGNFNRGYIAESSSRYERERE